MSDLAVAAVDCGTNSTRLLVLDADRRRLERQTRITRLGAGVDRTGKLDEASVVRTLSVLRQYRAVIDRHGVQPGPGSVRAAATSATRDAGNSDEFLEAAEEILGVRPEIIEGTEEGRLSYAGATAALDPLAGPYLVIDIGGGSTELIVGAPLDPPVGDPPAAGPPTAGPPTAGAPTGPAAALAAAAGASPGAAPVPAAVISLDIGCVRLTERHLSTDPPTDDELTAAHEAARELTTAVAARPEYQAARQLIGLAGTVAALTVMTLGLDHFDEGRVHHARMTREEVGSLTRRLASLPLEQRKRVRGMEAERADVIVGGAIILEEVMDSFGFDELTESESDILDGIAFGLLQGQAQAAGGTGR